MYETLIGLMKTYFHCIRSNLILHQQQMPPHKVEHFVPLFIIYEMVGLYLIGNSSNIDSNDQPG